MADLVDCATEPLKQAAAKAIGGKKDGHVCYIVHRLGCARRGKALTPPALSPLRKRVAQ